jgi:hypothetical protein
MPFVTLSQAIWIISGWQDGRSKEGDNIKLAKYKVILVKLFLTTVMKMKGQQETGVGIQHALQDHRA